MKSSRRRIRLARTLLAVGVTALVIAAGWGISSMPDGTWQRWITSLSPLGLVLALCVLPIVGFPVSVLHVATGARFGMAWGIVALAGATLTHLLLTYALARTMDGPLRRLLATFGWKLPQVPHTASWAFGFWIALLPGISYALKNAVPPLASVSLRVYVATAFPVHLATGMVGLAIGRATINFSWPLAGFIALYATGLALLSRKLARRIRDASHRQAGASPITLSQASGHTPAAGDRT